MFDEYWCADYSGSASVAGQRAAIRLAGVAATGQPLAAEGERFTRDSLRGRMLAILRDASDRGRLCMAGIDHQFSFPSGLYEALTGQTWRSWDQVTRLLSEGGAGFPAIVEAPASNAMRWVGLANARLAAGIAHADSGPFFAPDLPGSRPWLPSAFDQAGVSEYRRVERQGRGLKTVFRVGGQGAVGRQSLCGIPHLHRLLRACEEANVHVHAWPFEGWRPAPGRHVILEIYPGLFNRGEKSHDADAWESARWMAREDGAGRLEAWLSPALSEQATALGRLEGWVLGVPGDAAGRGV